jgi:hypothetical protein
MAAKKGTYEDAFLTRLVELFDYCQDQIKYAETKNVTLLATVTAMTVYSLNNHLTRTAFCDNSFLFIIDLIIWFYLAYVTLCVASSFVPQTPKKPNKKEDATDAKGKYVGDVEYITPIRLFKRILNKEDPILGINGKYNKDEDNLAFYGDLGKFASGESLYDDIKETFFHIDEKAEDHPTVHKHAIAAQILINARIALSKHMIFKWALKNFIIYLLFFLLTRGLSFLTSLSY